jgi:predicted  nucleic acid-binding Zn-ribbon protein
MAYGSPAVSSAPQEAEALKAQAAHMEKALDEIRKRIAELEATQSKEG